MIDQYVKLVPNLSLMNFALRPLLNKKSVYQWEKSHTITNDKLKHEVLIITKNSHFDIKEKTRMKTDAFLKRFMTTIEKFQGGEWKAIVYATRFLNNQ